MTEHASCLQPCVSEEKRNDQTLQGFAVVVRGTDTAGLDETFALHHDTVEPVRPASVSVDRDPWRAPIVSGRFRDGLCVQSLSLASRTAAKTPRHISSRVDSPRRISGGVDMRSSFIAFAIWRLSVVLS